jgi:hypothetical protein
MLYKSNRTQEIISRLLKISIYMNERYYLMSGQTLEDYFRSLNLDETRRKYLENIKEGKQVDIAIQEQHFKNGNVQQHSLIVEGMYSRYMKRFLIHRHPNPPCRT